MRDINIGFLIRTSLLFCYRCGNKASIFVFENEKCEKEVIKMVECHEESSKAPPPKTIVPYFL